MKIQKNPFFLLLLLFLCLSPFKASDPDLFAILISTSKFWFNYRQSTNVMLVYHKLKEYGVSDKNVLIN